jgi:fibro-slime domain-containing protein
MSQPPLGTRLFADLLMRRRHASWLIATLATLGCGARSGLYSFDCEEGDLRECSDPCGLGEQTCSVDGWGECVVPVAIEACSNECGSGTRQCAAHEWTECEIPVTTRACENDCGAGTEECARGAWQACETPVVTRPCDAFCGSGVEECRDGSWGMCLVAPVSIPCSSRCGDGMDYCVDGAFVGCDAPQPRPPHLNVTVRDFDDTHPDFEKDAPGAETGIVETLLGGDSKPVYAQFLTRSTSGREAFDQWYRDVPGINLSTGLELPLALVQLPDEEFPVFSFGSSAFFPIDGQLLGNQGRNHNFHFTLEALSTFRYVGGERFTFSGDDDLWVFINRRLAIDLGGLHTPLTGSVDLDQNAGALAIELGGVYEFHLFFAERHTIDSNFYIQTTLLEPDACD